MAIVISDTSPLRALSHLNRCDVLSALFGRILVPPTVVAEAARQRRFLPPLDVAAWPFIEVRTPARRDLVEQFLQVLDAGESEALALAIEVGAEAVLIDELDGRNVAEKHGFTTIGVLGILVRAKAAGLIDAVGPLVDRLQQEIAFRVSPGLRAKALLLAGESE